MVSGQPVTTVCKQARQKEERVAKLEWAPNGGLGRAMIGKVRRLTPLLVIPTHNTSPSDRYADERPRAPGCSGLRESTE